MLDNIDVETKDLDTQDGETMIKAGSHSRLSKFETCPYQAKLAYVDKIPEPDRGPPPKGLTEWHNDRGSRIHDSAEHFVRGNEKTLVPELENFRAEYLNLRKRFTRDPDSVVMEDMWYFDRDWVPLPDTTEPWSPDIYMRVKLDALVFLSPTDAVVIDYKTGKRFRNEIKHAEQCQLYQLAAFLRYPKLQHITTELWYLDIDEVYTMKFRRDQGLRFFRNWEQRMINMTTETEFPARPSTHTCFFCPYKEGLIGKYGPEGTGHCGRNP